MQKDPYFLRKILGDPHSQSEGLYIKCYIIFITSNNRHMFVIEDN